MSEVVAILLPGDGYPRFRIQWEEMGGKFVKQCRVNEEFEFENSEMYAMMHAYAGRLSIPPIAGEILNQHLHSFN